MGAGFDFRGQKILVTGASRGIGRGIAEGFAAAGADLTILADDAGIDTAAAELSAKHGRKIGALRCDIADRAAVKDALAALDRIDVLVNNAGLERITPIAEPGPEVEATFARIISINVLGSYYVTRDVLPKMQAGGRIIFTASIWGRTAAAEFSAYCASKHAIVGMTRSLAMELGSKGIRVNAVAPGWVKTDQSMLSLKRMAERSGLPEKQLLDEIMAGQLLPGLMEPDDIAGLYLFLASDAARNMTGQTVNIDRGEVLCVTAPHEPLAGKVALVTGAARGIGAACALAVAGEGASLILADRLDCQTTADAITTKGGKAVSHTVDVADEKSVSALFAAAQQQHARLDILVHCAGVIQEKPLLETTAADFDQVIAVNLRGSFLMGREALRWMHASNPKIGDEARAILIASDMSYYGREQFSPYVASKHGVLGLVRSWSKEFAPAILVNAICPGPIDTAMLDAEHMSPEWREKELQIPLHRFGEADEIGALAVFLAGPGGRYFTGQGIGPNGGSVMP